MFLSCSSFHLLIISSFLCAATDDANVSENEKSKFILSLEVLRLFHIV